MKKILILALLLLISVNAYAVDTNLGKLNLTDKQLSQSEVLKDEVIRGFSTWEDGTVVVVSTRELSNEEKNALKESLSDLPDVYSRESLEQRFNVKLFTDRLNKSFSGEEAIALIPYYAAVKDMASYPDFDSLKNLLLGLVSGGILSQDGYDVISGILLEQRIDLSTYGE